MSPFKLNRYRDGGVHGWKIVCFLGCEPSEPGSDFVSENEPESVNREEQ